MTAPPLHVARARKDTPGTERVADLKNACSSLPAAQMTEAMIAHLRLEASTGGYEAAAASSAAVDRCYPPVAELLSCGAHEVGSDTRAGAALPPPAFRQLDDA
jgi:cysteine desulfurase/selenocysteine lyase